VKRVVLHSEARAELTQAVAYYEEQTPGLGLDFLFAVERAVAQIQENPHFGARYKDTEFRNFVIRRFPYVIFYTEWEEAIWVVAVAHGKRRPDYWRTRRPE